MGIIVLCLMALALYVWNLSTKVSNLEKHLEDLMEQNKSLQKTDAPESKDENIKEDKAEPEPVKPADTFTAEAAKVSAPVIKTVQPQPVKAAESYIASDAVKPKTETETAQKPVINWELFTGVKLFAWIGGFAAFLGIIFFTKYAIDNNLISPLIRVCIGFAAGVALVCAGIFTKSEKLKTTGNVLCATGIIFVYVSAFAAGSFYHIFSILITFTIMIAASAGAFIISVHKNAKYIAVLAAVGGYLTPILLSSGSGAIVSLSVYMAILTVTIMMISVKKEWGFLVWLSSGGVFLILSAMIAKGFVSLRTYDIFMIFAGFNILFSSFALYVIKNYEFKKTSYQAAPFIFNILSMFFVFSFFGKTSYLAPALLSVINACILMTAANDKKLRNWYACASSLSFVILFIWTSFYLNQKALWFALAAYFIFFLLNAFLPMLNAIAKKEKPSQWYGFFPALLLLVFAVCAGKVYFVYLSFWPLLMIVAFFALAFSEITKNVFTGILSVFGVFVTLFVWLIATRRAAFDDISFAGIVCGFALGIFLLAAILKKKSAALAQIFNADFQETPRQPLYSVYNTFLISIFFLLSIAIIKIKPAIPDVFIASGLVISLLVVFLSLINESKNFIGVLFALISMFLMQSLWHAFYFKPHLYAVICLWYFIVFAFFFLIPFLFKGQFMEKKMPWFVSALAGVLQCFLIYFAARKSPQMVHYIGVVPAVFAVIYGLAVFYIMRLGNLKNEFQKSRIAIFTAAALFFITLIFPMHFKTQWLIVAWSLEAAALIALFKLVPYKPLKYWGFWLFVIVFLKLLIPDIYLFTVTAGSVLNWYLYMYAVAVIALFAGALLWFPKDEKHAGMRSRTALFSMGVILLFVLLNTEIAAFFATGKYIHFSFDNSFAQDMAYTLCWGLFSIGMFIVGIIKEIKAVRIAGLVLLSVTTLKLFLHDLWSLGPLYKIGSFFGLAAMLILVSFLYQKYINKIDSKTGG